MTYNNRGPELSYDGLLLKHPRESPREVLLKIKRYGTGLTRGISMEDGSSGEWAPANVDSYCEREFQTGNK